MPGTIYSDNKCNDCYVGVRITTGMGGTTIVDTKVTGPGVLYTDTPVVLNSDEKSSDTVVINDQRAVTR